MVVWERRFRAGRRTQRRQERLLAYAHGRYAGGRMRVALDAMGGDDAPASQVAGAILAARAWGYEVQLVGLEEAVRAALAPHASTLEGIEHLLPVVHAPEVIA